MELVRTRLSKMMISVGAAASYATPTRPTFDALYEMHFKFVWRCLRRLGVRSAYLDDACQDVFLIVHKKLDTYEPRTSPLAWLFAIARRVAHDYRRRESRKGGGLPLHNQHPSPDADPHQAAVQGQSVDIILEFLDTLPEYQREAFILSELEQLSAPEVAAAVSANVSTIYSRIHTARQGLARFVRRNYPDMATSSEGDRGA